MNITNHKVADFGLLCPSDFDQSLDGSDTKLVIFHFDVPNEEMAKQLQEAAVKNLLVFSRVEPCSHCSNWLTLITTSIKIESGQVPGKLVSFLNGFGAAHGAVLSAIAEIDDYENTANPEDEDGAESASVPNSTKH